MAVEWEWVSAANERKRAVKLIGGGGEAVRVVRAGTKVIRRDPAEAFATKTTRGSTMVNRWRRRQYKGGDNRGAAPPIHHPAASMASHPPSFHQVDATYFHAFLSALCQLQISKALEV